MPETLEMLPVKQKVSTEFTFIHTDWGVVGIIARGGLLVRLVLPARNEEQSHSVIEKFDAVATYERHLLPGLQQDIADYFQGKPVRFKVSLDLSYTNDFGRKILRACEQIEYGQTLSYGQLASQSGHPGRPGPSGILWHRTEFP